jgi:orotate phosphoribosyltransferase
VAEYTYLVGAEDVRNAGSSISSAADRMQQAGSSISESVFLLQRMLTDHAERMEAVCDRLEALSAAAKAEVERG